MQQTHCPKCGGEMENGFLMDIIWSGSAVGEPQAENLSWARGSRAQLPKVGLLERLASGIGFRLSSAESKPITSLRCIHCGYLELYAP